MFTPCDSISVNLRGHKLLRFDIIHDQGSLIVSGTSCMQKAEKGPEIEYRNYVSRDTDV